MKNTFMSTYITTWFKKSEKEDNAAAQHRKILCLHENTFLCAETNASLAPASFKWFMHKIFSQSSGFFFSSSVKHSGRKSNQCDRSQTAGWGMRLNSKSRWIIVARIWHVQSEWNGITHRGKIDRDKGFLMCWCPAAVRNGSPWTRPLTPHWCPIYWSH